MWTSTHFDLLSGPVNVWIMQAQPSVTQDDVLLPQTDDSKHCSFGMIIVVENTLCHTVDGASFIESTINIVYKDWSSKWSGGQLVLFNKCNVHEESGGPTN